ncbi:MAG: chemotaxis protein CheW [Candidatus Eremiobacteraeota bacterium]|nr:chemotaxis protein CheW [Candidatus Eremiobacteraeota bacterium]
MKKAIVDCWNTIGVRGDLSCPKLAQYTRCRNCPTYVAAAVVARDVALPDDYVDEWTRHVAAPAVEIDHTRVSVMMFRLGTDVLGILTGAFKEITERRTVHAIPHRGAGGVLGVVNVRGELVVCVSLREIIGIAGGEPAARDGHAGEHARMIVVERGHARTAFPVDEVYGTHDVRAADLGTVPMTIANATAAFTNAVLTWRGKTVALLDEHLLFDALDRRLGSAA